MLNKLSRAVRGAINGWKHGGRRAYAGAKIGRLLEDWIAGQSSADAEIRTSLRKLRDRSRQLARDNDFVRQVIRTMQNNVVGQGIKLQAQIKRGRGRNAGAMNTELNDQIEMLWKRWQRAEYCHTGGKFSFFDIERLIVSEQVQSGEVMIRIIKRSFGGSPVPLALEVIESDYLDELYNGRHTNGNEIRMGVERDEWGRPVAYHLKEFHPGDTQFAGSVTRESQRHRRIPAEEIMHIFLPDRVTQSRGVPLIASTITRLHQLGGYEEAEVIAARASAALMGFIESPEGEVPYDDVDGSDRVSDFEPGVFKYLAPGERVNVPQMNRPGGQFDPFMRAMLRGAAAGMGVSYESLSRDYSQSNYSSSRLALLDDRDNWKAMQKWLIERFHQRVFETWMEMAWASGALNLPGYEQSPDPYLAVRWMPRGWSWVDPAKEVRAFKDAVRCGFMTQSDVLAASGYDLEETMLRRQREVEMASDMELVFDTNPDQVAVNGSQQPDELVPE